MKCCPPKNRDAILWVVDPIVLRSLLNDVAELTGEHLVLVMISSGIAVLIGVGVGIAGTRRATLRRISLTSRMFYKPFRAWLCLDSCSRFL